MSLFDTVTIECDLPDTAPDWLKRCPVFQTNDLGGMMADYAITKDRQLVIEDTCIGPIIREALGITEQPQCVPVKYKRKRLELFATNIRGGRKVGNTYCHFTENGEQYVNILYVVWIRDGIAGPIREKSRSDGDALPMSEF